jgi:hypothetical protein
MHKTAMARKRVSKPMEWIVKNIDLAGDILHFGEGRAYLDTELLKKYGNTYIYEPHPAFDHTFYTGDTKGINYTQIDKRELPEEHFDYIIAIYVLNVLEPAERWKVLRWLREHGDVVLVAVRTDRIKGKRHLDGVMTTTGTFQKSYSKRDCENLGRVLTINSSFAIVEL